MEEPKKTSYKRKEQPQKRGRKNIEVNQYKKHMVSNKRKLARALKNQNITDDEKKSKSRRLTALQSRVKDKEEISELKKANQRLRIRMMLINIMKKKVKENPRMQGKMRKELRENIQGHFDEDQGWERQKSNRGLKVIDLG